MILINQLQSFIVFEISNKEIRMLTIVNSFVVLVKLRLAHIVWGL